MNRYQIMLSSDLEEAYRMIAEHLDMSMEQVLSSAVQIYAERLTLESFNGVCDTGRVRDYVEQSREAFTQCQMKAKRK